MKPPRYCPKCRKNVLPKRCHVCGRDTEKLTGDRLRWWQQTQDYAASHRKPNTALWIIPLDELDAAIRDSRQNDLPT